VRHGHRLTIRTPIHRQEVPMATTTIRNGVDVDRLVATIDAIKQDAKVAQFTFRANSAWESGARSQGRIEGFKHAGGESAHTGPNAVELVLQALAFCYGVGVIYNAAAQGIEIDELRYEIEGDLDLHRFVGLDGPRAGFSAIRAKGWIRSPNASRDQLVELCQYVQDTSPVRDILAAPVPVHTSLEVLDA
jgi:uncharacterized OsmC-like protein